MPVTGYLPSSNRHSLLLEIRPCRCTSLLSIYLYNSDLSNDHKDFASRYCTGRRISFTPNSLSPASHLHVPTQTTSQNTNHGRRTRQGRPPSYLSRSHFLVFQSSSYFSIEIKFRQPSSSGNCLSLGHAFQSFPELRFGPSTTRPVHPPLSRPGRDRPDRLPVGR